MIKVAVIGARGRYEKYKPAGDFSSVAMKFFPMGTPDEDILREAGDCEVLSVDAIAKVSGKLIEGLPQLKMIQSEGVAYNGIDVAAATKRGIYVCNNKGINAVAVAEQTVLLMLGLLRSFLAGDAAVKRGEQIQMKERKMIEGIRELADCRVGLIGLGDIGQATARLLKPFGCALFYYGPRRKPEALEQELGITYLEEEELIRTCDIISIHCPVTEATRGMVNDEFLSMMKPDAFLINTARGEMVDNEALVRALTENRIGGAGLDTIAPEPVTADNPLLHMSPEATEKLLVSPHLGGITTATFYRGFKNTWGNFLRIEQGERPVNIVNGL